MHLDSDIKAYCCDGVRGVRRDPFVERSVISRPFQQVALDIVGPLLKAKGGARYILTAVCMSTRCPEPVNFL